MTVLHPVSSMTTARLAAALLADGTWSHINRVEARDVVRRMELRAADGPAVESVSAKVLDAGARRLSALASAAYEQDGLVQDRDLSWLWGPEELDAIHRHSHVY